MMSKSIERGDDDDTVDSPNIVERLSQNLFRVKKKIVGNTRHLLARQFKNLAEASF